MALMICKYDIMLYIALGILAHSEAKKLYSMGTFLSLSLSETGL